MTDRPHPIINALLKKWRTAGWLCCLLLSLSAALPATMALHRWGSMPLWSGALWLALNFAISLYLFPFWRIMPVDIVRLLDKRFAELEESCTLLLRPAGELGLLERWQHERTAGKLASIQLPHPLRKKMAGSLGALAAGLLVSALIGSARPAQIQSEGPEKGAGADKTDRPVKPVPGLRALRIRVTPPAYTGRMARVQQEPSLVVEEGSVIQWELNTDAADSCSFLFNDSVRVPLKAAGPGRTRWSLSLPAARAGFYQLRIGERSSDLYKIELIQDQPPHITIHTPAPYKMIDYGEILQVPMTIRLQDDYGITDASVMATVASGSGEAVRFKERSLRFDQSFSGTLYDLRKNLDLAAMGLKPGDELYFYCRARDNHGQESRTDMYIISLADTAQLLSLDGLSLGVDVKPEYFRSERQIILETEQLLREKDTLSTQAFRNRSNDLGIDQKLLRLRYGKFLGEEAEEGNETESDIRASAGDSGYPAPTGRGLNFIRAGEAGDAARILEAFTDKHDNAEDATYFEPAIKSQLKATLTEMWGAELQLRTFHPKEALPFAYKALRLLKDLQQRSRAYVAKTGVKTTPPDPAKRLTGKPDGIGEPLEKRDPGEQREPTDEEVLRKSLSMLEGAQPGDRSILAKALHILGEKAAAYPARFLEGYQALKRILGGNGPNSKDVPPVQAAIRKLLPPAESKAAARRIAPNGSLSRLYFSHLNENPVRP